MNGVAKGNSYPSRRLVNGSILFQDGFILEWGLYAIQPQNKLLVLSLQAFPSEIEWFEVLSFFVSVVEQVVHAQRIEGIG
jgi:hypothetical protein